MPQKARRTWPKRAEEEGVEGGVGEEGAGRMHGIKVQKTFSLSPKSICHI